MLETRKYFDYRLSFKMYNKCVGLLEKGGIDELDEYFEEVGDRENGYTSYYGADYNTWVYIVNENFDTDKENESWLTSKGLYVSGEVDMISYSQCCDTLFINSKEDIEERMFGLVEFAKNNNYELNDIYEEYFSLKDVLNILKEER